MSLLFTPYKLPSPQGGLTLANRIVIAPMCQYASENGIASDWHLMHWGNLLNAGAGLFTIEATAVSPEGRITPHCLGLWDDATAAALADKLERARHLAPPTVVAIQLAHAGRKASSAAPWQGGNLLPAETGGWQRYGPSALSFAPGQTPPVALSVAEMERIRNAFVRSARYAANMGIKVIELHAAHGYLLHQFLSPLSNQRDDPYGGAFAARCRYPLEVFRALRNAFTGVLGIRLSATDWVPGGWTPEETVELCTLLKAEGCDFFHLSSGGMSPLQQIPATPGFQLPFAHAVKQKTEVTTMGVGLITTADQAETALHSGDADLIALARAFLYQPRWGWQAARQLGAEIDAHPRYQRGLPPKAS